MKTFLGTINNQETIRSKDLLTVFTALCPRDKHSPKGCDHGGFWRLYASVLGIFTEEPSAIIAFPFGTICQIEEIVETICSSSNQSAENTATKHQPEEP